MSNNVDSIMLDDTMTYISKRNLVGSPLPEDYFVSEDTFSPNNSGVIQPEIITDSCITQLQEILNNNKDDLTITSIKLLNKAIRSIEYKKSGLIDCLYEQNIKSSTTSSPKNLVNKVPQYYCFEGTDGVGKTTQTQKLCDYLTDKGYKVLQTKEPGINLLPITIKLREFMLNKKYDNELSTKSREFISQSIRSIHLEKLVYPALDNQQDNHSGYDFIIQDRGILSGLAYGEACGNDIDFLVDLATQVTLENKRNKSFYDLYDKIIYLRGNTEKALENAQSSKQEYKEGDVIESKGKPFMEIVQRKMDFHSIAFKARWINVENKNIETVFQEILKELNVFVK
jgi:thymidylate kinase